jgi:YD repeat-containing protein
MDATNGSLSVSKQRDDELALSNSEGWTQGYPVRAFAYQYDAAGNRIVVTSTTLLSGTVVTTNSYDAANRLTARSRSDGHAYTYDWSPRGQLLTELALSNSKGWPQGYPVRAFAYDGAGRMIEARVFTQTTEFVYNGLGARLAVSVDGYGTTLYTLDYAANNRILAETTPTSTVSYLYGHECLGEQREGELALSGAEGWLYYLPDAEGYVRQGADITGAIVSAWLFDPDGQGNHALCGFPCWKGQTARSATSSAAGCTTGRRG